MSSQEKRKYSRVDFSTRIDVRIDAVGNETLLEVDSRDVSLRGVFVRTRESFPVGTPCRLIIYLTGSMENIQLHIQGKVVRQAETGVGIMFDKMDLDTYTHLKNIVHYNSNMG